MKERLIEILESNARDGWSGDVDAIAWHEFNSIVEQMTKSLGTLIESSEFKQDLLEAIESGRGVSYGFNGSHQIAHEYYMEDLALENVLNVMKKYLL